MLPLEQVTILDLSRVLAGPFASMILAELGATVIKVEQPGAGDETRGFEPFVQRGDARDSAYFFACNRSKQSITVNLRSPDGQAVIRDLAGRADVFIENFPVGTMQRYGLHYEALRARNERIVYVSCTGFGQTGPYARKKGYDTVFQAMGGMMSLTGERDGGPVKPGLPIADLTSGLWVAIAILAMLTNWSVFQTLVFNTAARAPVEIAGVISAPLRTGDSLAANPIAGLQFAYDKLSSIAAL